MMMVLAAGLVLGLALSASAQTATGTYTVNLRSGGGAVNGSPAPGTGISWFLNPTAGSLKCVCDIQGVLKLSFDATHKRAVIQMTFEQSVGWTFDLGDSSTNDGYAGDASTQIHDAEVHSIGNQIFFYGRDNVPAGVSYGLIYTQPNFVGVQPYTTLTLEAKDEQCSANNGFGFILVNSYKLFQLNSQPDPGPGGVNNDLYLGLNRVVYPSSGRTGKGLCSVTVTFYDS